MKVFDIRNGAVELNPDGLNIPEFKELYKRDKSSDKEEAYKEISYIVYLCNYDSPYQAYSAEDREQRIKEDFLKDKKWNPDKVVLKALNRYKEFQQTTNSRLLESAKIAAEKLAKWFESIDFDELDDSGKPRYTANDVSKNLKEIGNIVKSLASLEEQVKKEKINSDKIRGHAELGLYEIPK